MQCPNVSDFQSKAQVFILFELSKLFVHSKKSSALN